VQVYSLEEQYQVLELLEHPLLCFTKSNNSISNIISPIFVLTISILAYIITRLRDRLLENQNYQNNCFSFNDILLFKLIINQIKRFRATNGLKISPF
jgi:hypothetical protein